MKIRLTLGTCILFASCFPLFSQSPVLVADLNAGTADACDEFNYKGIRLGNKYLLPADNGTTGQELYVLENDQLSLFKDINPGTTGSKPKFFTAFNNKAYFVADDGMHGSELWYSDGTAGGTQLAIDVAPGPAGSAIKGMITDGNGYLYFSSAGFCYSTDGSGIATLVNGPSGVDFSDNDNFAGARVCRFQDGIAFILLKNQTVEIWQAKGTTATKLYSLVTNSSFTNLFGLTPVATGLVYGLYDSFDSSRDGFYAYDATTQQAMRLAILGTSTGTSRSRILAFTPEKAIVLNNTGFYATDGTAAGTILLHGGNPGLYGGEYLSYTVEGNKMIYLANESSFSQEIRVTDGTASGSVVTNTTHAPFVSPMIHYLEHVWYVVGTSNLFKPEIWHASLKTGVSSLLYAYTAGSSSGPSVLPLDLIGNKLYFVSNMGGVGRELYRLTVSQNTAVSDPVRPEIPYTLLTAGSPGMYRIGGVPDAGETLQVRIFGSNGQLAGSREIVTGSDFSLPYPNGIYMLEVRGKAGMAAFKAIIAK